MSEIKQEGSLESNQTTNITQSNSKNYRPANPLIQTVSDLKNFTNNIRVLTDSFEQLLDSVENFAPALEIVSKGRDYLFRRINPKQPGKY